MQTVVAVTVLVLVLMLAMAALLLTWQTGRYSW